MCVHKWGSRNTLTNRQKYKCCSKTKSFFLLLTCYRLAFLRSVEILSDAITIMQVTPILQMINLKEDPDSNFRISRSKPDTILSMKIRYHSSTFKSVFYTHPLPVS